MSSLSRSGYSAKISAVDIPFATRLTNKDTVMRIPLTQARPPIMFWANVIRSDVFRAGNLLKRVYRAGGSERTMFGAGCNSLIAAQPGGVRCHAEDFMGLFSAVIVVERDRLSKNLRGALKLFRSVPGVFAG